MWPSEYISNLCNGPFHERSNAIANILIGNDSSFDFDMLVSKAGHTNTDAPWHQDGSYWLSGISDKRAASFWCALDNVFVDNGCMWFMPYSVQRETEAKSNELFAFERVKEGSHVLQINDETFTNELYDVYDGGIAVALSVGSCTVHHSRTPHMTKGNCTSGVRRALIANYRPKAMVEYERNQGYDHGQKGLEGLID